MHSSHSTRTFWSRRTTFRLITRTLVLTAALLFPAPATETRADQIQPSETAAAELQRIESGEIIVTTRAVTGRTLPLMRVRGLVKAPPQKVWPIVDDCAGYKDTMPRTLESEEVARFGDRVRCRGIIDMPFPLPDLVSETDSVLTIEPGRHYRKVWKHRSGDFRANEGSWTLEAHDGGRTTLATYEAIADPNIPIPQFLLTMAQKVTLPRMIETLREHAE